jgi:hypothetical protein
MDMKKLIVFLSLLLLVSCNTQKRVTENVTQKQQTEAEVKKALAVKESLTTANTAETKVDSSGMKALELIEKLTQDYESRLKTYDTTKPIDPQTGRPPLASELEIKNKTIADKKQTGSEQSDLKKTAKAENQTDWNKVINSRIDSAMKANEKIISNTEVVENKTGWPWWLWMIIGAGLLAVGYFTIKYKWWKKIMILF